jgi:Uma2 family endonuclease
MTLAKPLKMDADTFLAWAMDQAGRYELAAGEVIAMAPERAIHARTKNCCLRALERSIEAGGLDCEAFPDGMAVRIDDTTIYEPDALVRCGPLLDADAVQVVDPVIIVEVLSPSTRALDAGAKLADYFHLPSVRHYLIVKTDTRSVIHHARGDDGSITTRIVSAGPLRLDPPGIAFDVASLFPMPAR